MEKPAVSFVVPCFNEKPAIVTEALSSVAAQTFGDFECLIIDESTNAETKSAIAAFCKADDRFHHVVPDRRLGLAGSLNLGIELSRSDLIARFDSDDICASNRIQLQLAALAQNPKVGVIGGALDIMTPEGLVIAHRSYPTSSEDISRKLHLVTPLAHPTVMIRKDVLLAAGCYDPSFKFAEDLDLWLRLHNAGVQFANLPQTLVQYRQGATNRNPIHWRYNARARRKNFRATSVLKRLVGIVVVSGWSYVPVQVQRLVFRFLLLKDAS